MRINFSTIGKLFGSIKHMPHYFTVITELIKWLEVFENLRKLVKGPMINAAVALRKALDEASVIAKKTDNTLDDKAVETLIAVTDQILAFFNADDDYEQMKELDNQAGTMKY